nr:ABC transporter permease [Candidatus Gracilibacteria bacterium]
MLLDITKLATKSLGANRLRTFLSILGIIIGVFTIVLVVAIGKGVEKLIDEQFKFLSVTTIIVAPIDTDIAKSKLSIDDIDTVIKESKHIKVGTPFYMGNRAFTANSTTKQYNVFGGNTQFNDILNFKLKSGRFFTEDEYKRGDKVVVLGKNVVKDIYGEGADVIGKSINLGKKKFKIIGVLDTTITFGNFSFDDSGVMPVTTANKFIAKTDQVYLFFNADKLDNMTAALLELKNILVKTHKLKEGDSEDFLIRDQGTILVMAKLVATGTTYLLVAVGAIVLLVSGIGVMNVMFAGVAERKKEIGIAKAVGAREKDILSQFLIEAIFLTIFGAMIGIFLAESLVFLVNVRTGREYLVRSNFGDILALVFAFITGITSGVYPSYKAAKLDVVEALK